MNQLKKNISIQSNKFGSECGLDGYYGDVLCMMASKCCFKQFILLSNWACFCFDMNTMYCFQLKILLLM
jgi:hypothetical protein